MWWGQNVTAAKEIIEMKKMPSALKAQTPGSVSLFRSVSRVTKCVASEGLETLFLLHASLSHMIWRLHGQLCVRIRELIRSGRPYCVVSKIRSIAKNSRSPVSAMHGRVIRSNPVIACIICYWYSAETQPKGKFLQMQILQGASFRSQTCCTEYREKRDGRIYR